MHHARVAPDKGLQQDPEQYRIELWGGEAEFYALVAAASEALGISAMTADYGDEREAYLYADASAAIGVANREGLGRIATSTPSLFGSNRRLGRSGWAWVKSWGLKTRQTS